MSDETEAPAAPAVSPYAAALARINAENTLTATTGGSSVSAMRSMSPAQREELQRIAAQEFGGGDDEQQQATEQPSGREAAAAEMTAQAELLAPFGLERHAGQSTAADAVAVARMFTDEGIEAAQGAGLLKHFGAEHAQPMSDAQVEAALDTLSEDDFGLVSGYLQGLNGRYPQLRILESLRQSGLLGNTGFLSQVAEHARARRR